LWISIVDRSHPNWRSAAVENNLSPFADVEQMICQLEGVISARVIADEEAEGQISEIHVLAELDRPAKEIVRDVESILVTQKGIRIDHKKISVARIKRGTGPAPETRIEFRGISVSANGLNCDVTVELMRDGEPVNATVSGPTSKRSQLRMIASATLGAVNNLLPLDYSLVLEDIDINSIGGEEVVIAIATLLTMRGEERRLVGCSLVGHDLQRAVAYAVLDAVNRSIPIIFRKSLAKSEETGGTS